MDNVKALIDLATDARTEALKFFEKGNAQAGTRLRKLMQQVRDLAKTIRDEVTAGKEENKAAKEAEKAKK